MKPFPRPALSPQPLLLAKEDRRCKHSKCPLYNVLLACEYCPQSILFRFREGNIGHRRSEQLYRGASWSATDQSPVLHSWATALSEAAEEVQIQKGFYFHLLPGSTSPSFWGNREALWSHYLFCFIRLHMRKNGLTSILVFKSEYHWLKYHRRIPSHLYVQKIHDYNLVPLLLRV